MSNKFFSEFLSNSNGPSGVGGRITKESRKFMSQLLDFEPQASEEIESELSSDIQNLISEEVRNTVQNLSTPLTTSHSTLSSGISILITLVGKILAELEENLPRLMSLNPSRRDAIAHHLETLAGTVQRPLSLSPSPAPASAVCPTVGLRRWIEGPRSAAQNMALRTYFEEVAVIALGQALLLKNWSDRGIRSWSESDLGRLNWALSTALKPDLPLDREGWQITKPNRYSWYSPGTRLQGEIWNALNTWKIPDEGPNFLATLLNPTRRAQPEYTEATGYDVRFYQALWSHLEQLDWSTETQAGPLKRSRVLFSPTLRDGTLARTGPQGVQWIGLETSHFQLMIAELMQIWWGPTAPPLWCMGTGIEVHSRDQLAFVLGSPKPSVMCRIADMEACDAAFVLEEQIVRTQGRSSSSMRFREQVEGLPYFKKLRAAGTSLGTLQAAVALSKLRPGGLLIWAREEALGPKEGAEVLAFLLDRAKLLCEWNFSELEHSLPEVTPLYPKHLYLFQRETVIDARLSHRPVRHCIQGQMRSHVELPLLLKDAFDSSTQTSEHPMGTARGQWTILSHPSPTSQREWIEKWPDPASTTEVRHLDQLRANSFPLAQFTTIRPTPEGDPNRNGAWTVHPGLRGLWISAEYSGESRKLIARRLPSPGQEAQGQGFLVLVSDEPWVVPLGAYLMSELVQKWLNQHAERRGERWILNEQVVKWIPVPKSLLRNLGVPSAGDKGVPGPLQEVSESSLPLSWQKLLSDVTHHAKEVKENLLQLEDKNESRAIHCAVFTHAARALDYLTSGQQRLFSLVNSQGKIRWRELLAVLPKSECVSVSVHPKIRLTGSLPPHLPIGKIDRVKSPSPGILLTTETGFSLHIGSEAPVFILMLWEQLEGMNHPTWNELVQYLQIPRKAELAESTAFDILRSHGEQSARLKDLQELLSTCRLF